MSNPSIIDPLLYVHLPTNHGEEKPDRARFHIKATLVRAYLSIDSQYSVLTKTLFPSADKQSTAN